MDNTATQVNAREALASMGFPEPVDVASLHSIAHLFGKSKSRCGIYLLGFVDGLFYIGQAVDAAKRFVQHRREHPDITSFSFVKVKRKELDAVERALIHDAESRGLFLKNKVHVSQVLGESDLDDLMTTTEQEEWLEDPERFNAADSAARISLSKQHRLRYRDNYLRFSSYRQTQDLIRLLRTYILNCVPAFRRTELAFWSLSCMPSTNSRHAPRFVCLNMNVMETFVIGYQRDSVNDTWGFVNVSFEALEAAFQSADAFYALYPAVSVRGTGYRAAGYDQAAVDCFTLGDLNQILADPRVRHAAAVLNLRLMQKGPNVYSRFHCLDLADKVLENKDPSEGVWV